MLDTWLRPEEGIWVNRDEGGGSPSGMIMMIVMIITFIEHCFQDKV